MEQNIEQNNDMTISPEDLEYGFYIKLLNLYQTWYNKYVEPEYPSMIEDSNDEQYTNGSLESFYEFMTDFKNNINNLSMTRTYKLHDFLIQKPELIDNEYYVLKITNQGKYEEFASPLILSLFIFLSKINLENSNWTIEIH